MITDRSLKQASKIRVGSHAFKPWNRRVGPIVSNKRVLEKIFNKYLLEKDRVEIYDFDCLLFDQDILAGCAYDKKTNTIVIKTFLGRISTNPSLANYHHLMNYIKRSMDKDRMDLSLSPEVLKQQELPKFSTDTSYFDIGGYKFKVSYWGNLRYEIKQILGNGAHMSSIFVEINKIHKVFDLVTYNALSHIHGARLCAMLINKHKSLHGKLDTYNT